MLLPKLKVKQDVATKRNSTLIMLERFVNIKSLLSAIYPLSMVIRLVRELQNSLNKQALRTDVIKGLSSLLDVVARRIVIRSKQNGSKIYFY